MEYNASVDLKNLLEPFAMKVTINIYTRVNKY